MPGSERTILRAQRGAFASSPPSYLYIIRTEDPLVTCRIFLAAELRRELALREFGADLPLLGTETRGSMGRSPIILSKNDARGGCLGENPPFSRRERARNGAPGRACDQIRFWESGMKIP